MKRTYRNYTDEDVVYAASVSTSIAGTLRCLGLIPAGGNYANLKRKLQLLSVDTTHWTGAAWSKDKQLKDWSGYTRSHRAKPHLIKLRGHQCEACKITEWQGFPVPLELHHVDGDRTNNQESNWLLVCPNCHACTDSWRGRNK